MHVGKKDFSELVRTRLISTGVGLHVKKQVLIQPAEENGYLDQVLVT
jgi:hypothetical protein